GGGNVGIGFAIPINMARQIMDQLVTHGEIRRGRLGVTAQNLTPELAQAFGLKEQRGTVVAEVAKGSPADQAGVRVGDIIVSVDGRPVESAADVRNRIGLLRVGDEVSLELLRDGKLKRVRAVVQEPTLTTLDGQRLHPRLAGAIFGNIEEGMPQYGRVEGVLLTELDPRSPAAHTGLRPGDLVVSVNRVPVKTIADMEKAARGAGQSGLLLNVQRGGGALFLLIR
ncbi:MAG: PDZ domain-containing protein, partial [Gammaproteobacteria bacterium]